MIFLRLECDLRALVHGSRFDTCRNLAYTREDDHKVSIVEQLAI